MRGRILKPIKPDDRRPSALLSDATRAALATRVKFTQKDEKQAIKNMARLEHMAKAPKGLCVLLSSDVFISHREYPLDACEADESFASTHTVSDDKASALFPDMVVSHIHTVAKEEPASEADKRAWRLRQCRKARHNCHIIIEEIKPAPSRRAEGEVFQNLLKERLSMAQDQVFDYARSYFERDRLAGTVITMAAAGPYWQWIKATRKQCYPPPPKEGQTARTTAQLSRNFLRRFAAAPVFCLGTPESDAELTRMRDTTLIPLVERHRWYPIQLRDKKRKDGKVQKA